MKAADELKEWLENNTLEKVQRNVKIVTPEDINRPFLLHISTDTNIRSFTPVIGRRQGLREDRTVPRVCVSSSLLGCMIGYSAAAYDFLHKVNGDKNDFGVTYKGGWKIYAIPFQVALQPNSKLVYDADHSDEHWLVTYNKDTVVYKPESAGKVFYHSITYTGRSGKTPGGDGVLYVEVNKEEGIWFTRDHFLKKGYWKIDGPIAEFSTLKWSESVSKRLFTITELSKTDYLSAKNVTADLLGFTENAPIYSKW